jgi:hypothetical protein
VTQKLRQIMPMLTTRQKRLADPSAIAIEPIDRNPAYQQLLAELEAHQQRLKDTEARRKRAVARARGAKPERSPLARAKDLALGGQVPGFDAAAELAACEQEELQILRPAIVELTARLDDLRGDLSLNECEKLRAQHNAALIAALHAIEDLVAALDVAAGIRARVRTAGYVPLGTVLPAIAPPAVFALGDPANVGASQSWYFKRSLERLGIL